MNMRHKRERDIARRVALGTLSAERRMELRSLEGDTVKQTSKAHPALAEGTLRQWVHRADADDPEFQSLRIAIVRVGRSVFLDEVKLRAFLFERSALPPAAPRRR